jgi:predicted 3-demethylubiquinone-9 3-methyltransferase (glyoxalase superfamily)
MRPVECQVQPSAAPVISDNCETDGMIWRRDRVIDCALPHAFTFTPAVSIWLELDAGEDIRTLYESLSQGGTTHMPLAEYGFSQQNAWVDDRFGVSWQINRPFPETD